MNLSTMRDSNTGLPGINLNESPGRPTVDEPEGATPIAFSNPWRDDIWGEYIIGYPGAHPSEAYVPGHEGEPNYRRTHTFVVGARNWLWDETSQNNLRSLAAGNTKTILFDPWWVAATLVWPPPPPIECPPMLNADGTSNGYTDPNLSGVVPCGDNIGTYRMPMEALFDSYGNCTAKLISFYVGIEMAGSAVYGSATIGNWTIQSRW